MEDLCSEDGYRVYDKNIVLLCHGSNNIVFCRPATFCFNKLTRIELDYVIFVL